VRGEHTCPVPTAMHCSFRSDWICSVSFSLIFLASGLICLVTPPLLSPCWSLLPPLGPLTVLRFLDLQEHSLHIKHFLAKVHDPQPTWAAQTRVRIADGCSCVGNRAQLNIEAPNKALFGRYRNQGMDVVSAIDLGENNAM
jgi:hypothetical protein